MAFCARGLIDVTFYGDSVRCSTAALGCTKLALILLIVPVEVLITAQLLMPVSGRVQLKGRGLLDPTWLHDAQADSAGYRYFF